MEHYGWCVGALWVVCGSIRERNYRLEKKNYLSGPSCGPEIYCACSSIIHKGQRKSGVISTNIEI